MSAAEIAIDDPIEAAVLERAQQNCLDNGPGNRMWVDPSVIETSTTSTCFTLSAAERAAFIAVARVEIERDGSVQPGGDSQVPSESPTMSSGINALYENRNGAQAAMATLVAAGIPEDAIRLVVGSHIPGAGCVERGDPHLDGDTLWCALREIGLPQEAWSAYYAKLTAGGAMLNLAVVDAERDRVLGILNDHGSVDPTQRVATWRAEGWGGTSPVSTEGWGGYSATSTAGKTITDSQG